MSAFTENLNLKQLKNGKLKTLNEIRYHLRRKEGNMYIVIPEWFEWDWASVPYRLKPWAYIMWLVCLLLACFSHRIFILGVLFFWVVIFTVASRYTYVFSSMIHDYLYKYKQVFYVDDEGIQIIGISRQDADLQYPIIMGICWATRAEATSHYWWVHLFGWIVWNKYLLFDR